MIKTQLYGFPQVYKDVDTSRLIEVYAQGPGRLAEVIDSLSLEELRAHPKPDKWSILEIVLHMVDSEAVGALRLRKIWAENNAELPIYDQDGWALQLDYQSASKDEMQLALAHFRIIRTTMLKYFHKASGEVWDKYGIHPEYGKVTLRNLLELYADHSERHIEQIQDLRRVIGKPTDVSSMLPIRLY